MDISPWVYRLAVLVAGAVSVGSVVTLVRPGGRWGQRLRRRFTLGVPWGTLLTMAVVLTFYLVVQGGWGHWRDPLVIPFRAWSYLYPVGVLSAGLAHAGVSHLTGNLLGTLVFGGLAEYAWSHFPVGRGGESFRSLSEHPFVRALVFPFAAVAAAVFTGLFGLGPVVGFSGVVFAFVGFAAVRYPVTVLVLLAASDVVGVVYRSLLRPVVPGSAGVGFSSPWWAGIAIQGHAIGFFVGVVAGVLLFRRRGTVAPAGRVWLAVLGFTAAKGMWAVYLIEGGGKYVLFRALGVAFLFLIAALVVAAARASDRDLVPSIGLTRREAAVGLAAAVLLALALVAVPYNLLVIENSADTAPEQSVEVRDYAVFYDEDVENQLVAAYDVPGLNTSGTTNSGVIVRSRERGIWWEAASKDRLAFSGRKVVRLGGIGWRERVVANRSGWNAVGGPTAYKIHLRTEATRILAYTSDGARAEPTVRGHNVTVVPTEEGFELVLSRGNETVDRAPIPARNESRAVAGIAFAREQSKLFATANGTRVRVATKESYRG